MNIEIDKIMLNPHVVVDAEHEWGYEVRYRPTASRSICQYLYTYKKTKMLRKIGV